ncbi:hypothetical protein SAMN05661044_00629 [Olivibacter domesticus]|uniref:Uncharacterized protein n=2 Tax=Olivibacter domesticus TaxID=407022 RepID=A0A1H7ICA9_OLID1|nr:hypothetical protein SAMN05661044_00629 [Olivibacter domesticus]
MEEETALGGQLAGQRQLPEMVIGEQFTFIVDVAYGELRKKDNPLNCIRFSQMEKPYGQGYSFWIDRRDGRLVDSFSEGDSEQVLRVELDEAVKLDPVGVAQVMGVDVKNIPLHDEEIVAHPALYKSHTLGKEPMTVSILGEHYLADHQFYAFRCKADPERTIPFDKLHFWDFDAKAHFYFDLGKREVVDFPGESANDKRQVVAVVISAQQDQDNGGIKIPYNSNHEARVFPAQQISMVDFYKEMERRSNNFYTVYDPYTEFEHMPPQRVRTGKHL